MRISIIIPCYNSALFIRQTLDSIISQEYDNLELIVIDGDSNDGTKEIIEEYRQYISFYVSESDSGQYDAINKGMKLATGEVLAWLNSDDIYFPWTLKTVSFIFKTYQSIDWISGMPSFTDTNGNLTNIYNVASAKPSEYIRNGWFHVGLFGYLQQEGMFWRKSVWIQSLGINQAYKLAGDFELWTRFAQQYKLVSVGLPLAAFRKHGQNRSIKQQIEYENEVRQVCKSMKKPNLIIQWAAKKGIILNRIVRLLVWIKSPVIFYSVSKQQWKFSDKRRPISNLSLSHLFLEI